MEPMSLENWLAFLAPLSAVKKQDDQIFFANDPREVAFRLTLFYESPRNLSSHLEQIADFRPDEAQANSIAACLRQGREFLQTAQLSDLMIKPILLYYGMAWSASALALSFGEPRDFAQLPKNHGLKVPAEFGVRLEDLQVQVSGNDGLFHRFVGVLDQLSGILAETRDGHRLWLSLHAPDTPLKFKASLKELLARVVGLEDFFAATFAEPSLGVPVELKLAKILPAATQPQGALVFTIPKGVDENWLYKLHPRLKGWTLRDKDGRFGDRAHGRAVFENLPPGTPRPGTAVEQAPLLQPLADLLVPATRTTQAGYRLIGALGSRSIPAPAVQLATSYLLSAVARYRPDIWSAFSAYSPSDPNSRLRALIDAFLERCLTVYPLEVLGALARRDICVSSGQPAIWG